MQVLIHQWMSIGKIVYFQIYHNLFSLISVDYNKYRSLNNNKLYYYQVTLTKGDCLYLPYLWIHQVRSKNRNVAINYWLNHERVKNAIVNKDTCVLNSQSDIVRLDTIKWPKETSNTEQLKNFMIDLVNEGFKDLKEWTQEFSEV